MLGEIGSLERQETARLGPEDFPADALATVKRYKFYRNSVSELRRQLRLQKHALLHAEAELRDKGISWADAERFEA